MRQGESRAPRYLKERSMKIFKVDRRRQAQDGEAELPYDHEPIFFYPATCPICDGDGEDCIWCKPMTPISAARLPLEDMTIGRRR
jgi:hypothetical protein